MAGSYAHFPSTNWPLFGTFLPHNWPELHLIWTFLAHFQHAFHWSNRAFWTVKSVIWASFLSFYYHKSTLTEIMIFFIIIRAGCKLLRFYLNSIITLSHIAQYFWFRCIFMLLLILIWLKYEKCIVFIWWGVPYEFNHFYQYKLDIQQCPVFHTTSSAITYEI